MGKKRHQTIKKRESMSNIASPYRRLVPFARTSNIMISTAVEHTSSSSIHEPTKHSSSFYQHLTSLFPEGEHNFFDSSLCLLRNRSSRSNSRFNFNTVKTANKSPSLQRKSIKRNISEIMDIEIELDNLIAYVLK